MPTASPPVAGSRAPRPLRPEIQALRAAAVLAVLVYHLHPSSLPGGFIGVDVFFVISGFLITSHLISEARRTGKIKLSAFWARRARRLLPASMTVLAATAVATIWLVPTNLWTRFFHEITASTLYSENWSLAANSVDYFANDTVTPVQHFWSLGVEEQFYLVWPILIGLAAWFTARKIWRFRLPLASLILAVVLVGSFLVSLQLTVSSPGVAYVATHARVWEFAGGGLIAFLPRLVRWETLRGIAAWFGAALITVSLFWITPDQGFPAPTAGVSVIGTALVIVCGTTKARWTPAFLSRFRPIQWTGDVSYSIYLWHWPLIVLLPFVTGFEIRPVDMLIIVVATFVLAGLSYSWVENPFRGNGQPTFARTTRSLLGAAGAMLAVLAICLGPLIAATASKERSAEYEAALMDAWKANSHLEAELRALRAELEGKDATEWAREEALDHVRITPRCIGAAAMDGSWDDVCAESDLPDPPIPSLETYQTHRSFGTPDCRPVSSWSHGIRCEYATGPDPLKVAIVGDSHIMHWYFAIDAIARAEGWRLFGTAQSSCQVNTALEGTSANGVRCRDWNATLVDKLSELGPYDVIIVSSRARVEDLDINGPLTPSELHDGFVDALTELGTIADTVIVLHDIPLLGEAGDLCQQRHVEDPNACTFTATEVVLHEDPLALAAEDVDFAHVVNLNDYFCNAEGCPVVIGGVRVYRDKSHMTELYSETLAPYLWLAIRQYLPSPD